MSVLYNDVQKGQQTARNAKVFEIDAVTIKKSMTEYHHWINVLAAHLFLNTVVYGRKWVWWIWAILATCIFSLFWST